MRWADHATAGSDGKPQYLQLEPEALDQILEWRNDIFSKMSQLPDIVKGFLPKAVGYILRLSGLLYCMRKFAENMAPAETLTVDDINAGIDIISFYLGHMVDSAYALTSKGHFEVDAEMTPHEKHLAVTLESLRDVIDDGHLAIGFIHDKYLATCSPENYVRNSHSIGALMRNIGLTLPVQRRRANGRSGICCLKWDEKTDNFIKQVHNVHQVHEARNEVALGVWTLEHASPSKSPKTVDLVDLVDSVDSVDEVDSGTEVSKTPK